MGVNDLDHSLYFALLDNFSNVDLCTPEICAPPHLASTSLNQQEQ